MSFIILFIPLVSVAIHIYGLVLPFIHILNHQYIILLGKNLDFAYRIIPWIRRIVYGLLGGRVYVKIFFFHGERRRLCKATAYVFHYVESFVLSFPLFHFALWFALYYYFPNFLLMLIPHSYSGLFINFNHLSHNYTMSVPVFTFVTMFCFII